MDRASELQEYRQSSPGERSGLFDDMFDFVYFYHLGKIFASNHTFAGTKAIQVLYSAMATNLVEELQDVTLLAGPDLISQWAYRECRHRLYADGLYERSMDELDSRQRRSIVESAMADRVTRGAI